MNGFTIRPYQVSDEAALYRVCLETGDSGEDASALYEDPQLLGHVYAAPYGRFQPDLAFVLEDAQGVCGYVIGALDTRAFFATLEREWWPDLRARSPLPTTPPEARTPDERIIAIIHRGLSEPEGVLEDYPSHLHIDLLPRGQRGGNGRHLIETLLDALRRAGSPGVHLGVGVRNTRAIGFYHHLGFEELARDPWGLTLGLKL